ncbi:hypothetical protein [Haloterrigena alkaliphila]|uniref:PemK-like, MazF-like toxin of type II toxin-antitoxin system n=1 Tax=Haloterrigena alkaliphila TaxID=2816475 RepID=A0A8A2VGF6_9EURY|nr:hypothetical protein [Haloterrigena alkaliphila]QSX00602.1 hypothetical protein J0X25_06490 [Haloterrigena alkaliphila]
MHERGVIGVAADPFGNTPRRPYLIVSDGTHPFAGRQCIALGITTKEYAESLPLAGSFETGTLNRESFVSPWAVVSIQGIDIDRAVARVTEELTETAIDEMTQYVGR